MIYDGLYQYITKILESHSSSINREETRKLIELIENRQNREKASVQPKIQIQPQKPGQKMSTVK